MRTKLTEAGEQYLHNRSKQAKPSKLVSLLAYIHRFTPAPTPLSPTLTRALKLGYVQETEGFPSAEDRLEAAIFGRKLER